MIILIVHAAQERRLARMRSASVITILGGVTFFGSDEFICHPFIIRKTAQPGVSFENTVLLEDSILVEFEDDVKARVSTFAATNLDL